MNSLNSECRSGNYIKERIEAYIGSYGVRMDMAKAIKEELSNRIIQVVLKDCEVDE